MHRSSIQMIVHAQARPRLTALRLHCKRATKLLQKIAATKPKNAVQ
jgi:hypothetical protein